MIQLILDDSAVRPQLFPFTLTRTAADIRVGILTIRQKWERLLGMKVRVQEDAYLDPPHTDKTPVIFPGNIIPSKAFADALLQGSYSENDFRSQSAVRILERPWQIVEFNEWALREDFVLITNGRSSAPLPPSVAAINPENIFIEKGAKLSHCILNASSGPIYIGENAEIMEGATIRGPFALCDSSVVKMGARIYGSTTVGPNCVVGGEIKNSMIFGYSNKAHDGYLGDSVIGEWCNLGAGTSNSNLKNTGGPVNVWSISDRAYVSAGLKCGLLMGDYSRSAINTSFNTGTVVGACANVFGNGLLPKYIPSFSWGTGTSPQKYDFEQAIIHLKNWKKFKNQQLEEKEIQQLEHIFDRE